MSSRFFCPQCRTFHEGLPSDWAFRLPDVVWDLAADRREAEAVHSSDLCEFDGRYFIRGVLPMRFLDKDGEFGWGVLAEVDGRVFHRYLDLYEVDASDEPPHAGTLANRLPGQGPSDGPSVSIQFQSRTQRPTFSLLPTDMSALAVEQRNGIGNDRHHDILKELGAI